MKCFVISIVILWTVSCLPELSHAGEGSTDRLIAVREEHSEPFIDDSDEQNEANGSLANAEWNNITSTIQPSTRPSVKIHIQPHIPARRHLQKRCCKIGYRAAKRRLFCLVDRYFSAKYTNMEHYAKQKFHSRPPSKRTRRFMYHFDRYCVKTQLKGVFYKCCLDGRLRLSSAGQ